MSDSANSHYSTQKPESAFVRWVNQWGSAVVDGITTIGDMTLFTWKMLKWLFTRLPCRGTVLINFYQVGAFRELHRASVGRSRRDGERIVSEQPD